MENINVWQCLSGNSEFGGSKVIAGRCLVMPKAILVPDDGDVSGSLPALFTLGEQQGEY